MPTNTRTEGQTNAPPSKKVLALTVGGAVVLATLVAVCFVLPATYQIDPTGFGRATGLTKLAAPQAELIRTTAPTSAARFYPAAYRSDSITIRQPGNGDQGYELEYKVRMKAGDSIIYSWTSDADPGLEAYYYDFHGETPAEGGQKAKVVQYKQETGVSSNGALTAPIDGVHGWYFLNDSPKAVTVRLKIAGFYELVAPGEYGNEAGIVPDR